jgi:hypothetical protein
MPRKKTPSPRTVRAKKAAMGFKSIKIKTKPLLSGPMMRLRELFAQQHMKRCFNSTVVLDEKWFSEEKVKGQTIEARPSSPLKGEQFKHKQGESETQLTKIMYLAAVTGQHKIGIYELDINAYNKKHGTKSKGVNTQLLNPIFKKIAKQARELMPHGQKRKRKISIWYDRASAHTSNASLELLTELFEGDIIDQPPKSPDLNMCDAALFPFLERYCEAQGALSKADIKKAVHKAWKALPTQSLPRMAKRVRRNLVKVYDLKGGNNYYE